MNRREFLRSMVAGAATLGLNKWPALKGEGIGVDGADIVTGMDVDHHKAMMADFTATKVVKQPSRNGDLAGRWDSIYLSEADWDIREIEAPDPVDYDAMLAWVERSADAFREHMDRMIMEALEEA